MVYRKATVIATLILIYFIGIDINQVSANASSTWYTHFIYMFFHANIFHLALNSYALYQCFSEWKFMVAAYTISVLGSYMISDPVVGFSSIICAIWGMTMLHLDKKRWLHMILIFTISFFIPAISWQIHLICFILGLIYILIAQLNHDYRKVISRK